LRFEPGRISELEPEDEETISVDIDALKALVLPLPDIPWRGVAGMCGRTITPLYKSLQNMLHEDTEHVARLFSDLEPLHDEDFEPCMRLPQSARWTNVGSGRGFNNSIPGDVFLPDRLRRRRSGSLSDSGHPLIIPSTHASIPTIIITPPYLPQPNGTFCRVPFQDSSFGNRLTLPAHPAFNEVFPPLVPTPYPLVPVAQNWTWVDGHWQAVLPTLEEQARKGMFSRTLMAKRKSCRRIGSRNTP
jgi:hypothetical protein